jgi:hypothetical protein
MEDQAMTVTWRNDSSRLRRRSAREGTGNVYYPAAFKRLLSAEPPRSKRDRDAQLAWLYLAMVGFAIGAAALIVTWAR